MTQLEWKISDNLVPYDVALAEQAARVEAIKNGLAPELIWVLQHPACYTSGTSAKAADLLSHDLPVFETGRGGQHTYHGPGQWVIYALLNLAAPHRAKDVRQHVWLLEEWGIKTLADLGVATERRDGRVGLWAPVNGIDSKFAAIGVRVSHWVTSHGMALNIAPNLADFGGIVPCGLNQFGVSSVEAVGGITDSATVLAALQKNIVF